MSKRWFAAILLFSTAASAVDARVYAAERSSEFLIGGEYRIRYETLNGQFRVGGEGGDQAIALRGLLRAGWRRGRIEALAEGIDSRSYLTDAGSVLDTSVVDAADLLQAHLKVDLRAPGSDLPEQSLLVGRYTLDLGRRRLIARNGYRNTINAFTGGLYTVRTPNGRSAQIFAAAPVARFPADAVDILNNETQLDREAPAVLFGAHIRPWAHERMLLETYAIGIAEWDGARSPSRNRRLGTIGARYAAAPAAGTFDAELEAAIQSGLSRSSTRSDDTTDLDHLAWFTHAEIGYSMESRTDLRFVAQIDYASGDRDPADSRFDRFDPLFGARGFEFAPTGIYGPISRANLLSAGARLVAEPARHVFATLAYRAFALASSRDVWTTAGLVDPTGQSGRFIGHHGEIQLGWRIRENVRIDVNGSFLGAGRFRREAPNAPESETTRYFSIQTQLNL